MLAGWLELEGLGEDGVEESFGVDLTEHDCEVSGWCDLSECHQRFTMSTKFTPEGPLALLAVVGLRDAGHQAQRGPTMARQPSFPPIGFLVLGVLSLAASVVFIIRAVTVEGTAERIWSAVLFGGFGVFWLAAYWSSRRHPTD